MAHPHTIVFLCPHNAALGAIVTPIRQLADEGEHPYVYCGGTLPISQPSLNEGVL